jgi:hypothetical protein
MIDSDEVLAQMGSWDFKWEAGAATKGAWRVQHPDGQLLC